VYALRCSGLPSNASMWTPTEDRSTWPASLASPCICSWGCFIRVCGPLVVSADQRPFVQLDEIYYVPSSCLVEVSKGHLVGSLRPFT
jgi:hypothetical protein